jgi:hypothetical protein
VADRLDSEAITRALEREAFSNPVAIELANQAAELAAMCKQIESTPITSQQDVDSLAAAALWARKRIAELEQHRKEQTAPARALLDGMREWYRPLLDACGALKSSVDARLVRHREEQQKAAHAAQVAAGEAFAAGQTHAGHAALANVPAPVHVPGMSFRTTQDYEITDAAAVPRELCSPDPEKIKSAIKQGFTQIPGVRVFQKTSAAATPGRRS